MFKTTEPNPNLTAWGSRTTDPAETARQILGMSGYPALKRLHCEYREGVVILRGVVSSYYQKQLAQAALLGSPLIAAVVNLVEVRYFSVVRQSDRAIA